MSPTALLLPPDEPTTRLSAEPREVLAQPQAAEAALLLVLAGPSAALVFVLPDQVVLGRSHQADIQLWDEAISRRHCRLQKDDHGYLLTDLGSLNGTYVNGQPVHSRWLVSGDRIQIGSSLLQFLCCDELEKSFLMQLSDAATHDPLTGLYNRRSFLERLKLEIAVALRQQTSLYVLYIDLDGFKAVNDRWGHSAGDQVLIQVAQSLQAEVRREDLLARFGGDEFALLVRGSDENQVLTLARRLRQVVYSLFIALGGEAVRLSCSIGIASLLRLTEVFEPCQLLAAADAALYQAKVAGGNREVLL